MSSNPPGQSVAFYRVRWGLRAKSPELVRQKKVRNWSEKSWKLIRGSGPLSVFR